jgi:hypothetical protein
MLVLLQHSPARGNYPLDIRLNVSALQRDDGLAIREMWLERLRALVVRTQGDVEAYTHFRDHYRGLAKTHGFQGHIAWAEAMQ